MDGRVARSELKVVGDDASAVPKLPNKVRVFVEKSSFVTVLHRATDIAFQIS